MHVACFYSEFPCCGFWLCLLLFAVVLLLSLLLVVVAAVVVLLLLLLVGCRRHVVVAVILSATLQLRHGCRGRHPEPCLRGPIPWAAVDGRGNCHARQAVKLLFKVAEVCKFRRRRRGNYLLCPSMVVQKVQHPELECNPSTR